VRTTPITVSGMPSIIWWFTITMASEGTIQSGPMQIPGDLPAPSTEHLRLVLGVDLGLLAIADRIRQHWTSHAVSVGLSTAQVKVLLMMEPGDAVPMRSLAARLDYDASNFSTLVDRLERRGAVERRADPADRRIRALALTQEGERLRESFWQGLIEDPGPLAPLETGGLRALADLLAALGVSPDTDVTAKRQRHSADA
jgi:DNA-binding MarR family transcriptional regulator